jgi:hypothetical protein
MMYQSTAAIRLSVDWHVTEWQLIRQRVKRHQFTDDGPVIRAPYAERLARFQPGDLEVARKALEKAPSGHAMLVAALPHREGETWELADVQDLIYMADQAAELAGY